MAHSLDALWPPVRIWDRQGEVLPDWVNLSQALDYSGLEPCILGVEGSFSILLRTPLDLAGRKSLLEQRDTWRHRLHLATVAVWWPADETLYQMTCLFAGFQNILEPGKAPKEWRSEIRFNLETRGAPQRTLIPARLHGHLAILVAFELDPDAEPIYRDWCREMSWLERFATPSENVEWDQNEPGKR
jgi:hypothetical protein